MIVGDIKLSYPYIRYNAVVTHFTSRKSTAIEWVILELVSKFSNSNEYGGAPVELIFKEILQISDSDLLIKPCLIDLEDLGAISVIGLNDNVSLREIPLRSINLTNVGVEMQRQGLLPGKDRDDNAKVCYDVIGNMLVEGNVNYLKEYSTGMPVINVQNEEEIDFPVSLINQKLLEDQKSRRYQWLQKTTRIKEVKKSEGQLLWRNISKKIKISGDGVFTIDGMEEDVNANSLLFNNMIEASEYDRLITSEELVENIDQEYSKVFFSVDLAENISESIKKDDICIIDKRFWNDRYLKDLKNKDANLLIQFNSDKFDFNHADKNILLQVPYAMPFQGCIILNNKENIFASRVNLHNVGGQAKFNLGYCKRNLVFNIKKIVNTIINQFKEENYEVISLYMLIDEEKAVLESLPLVIGNLHKTEDKIEVLDNLSNLCNRVSNKKINMDKEISNILINDILNSQVLYSLSDIKETIDRISEYKICSSKEKILHQCIASVLNKVEGIKKHSDILELWKYIFESKKINTSWIDKNEPFNNLYSKDVQVTLFEELLNQDYMNDYKEYTGIEKIYNQMRHILKTLSSDMVDWKQLYSKENMYEIIISKIGKIDGIRNLALAWKDNKIKLKSQAIDFEELTEESELLKHIHHNMELILDSLSLFYDDSLMKYDKVYIFDTCSLMNRGDILSLFSKNELVVVPTVVLKELDKHKDGKDERKAYEAREAIRQIDGNENIKFENAYPELLPIDLRDNEADNLILSIALKFLTKRPMVITDDNDLRIVAKSQRIMATSVNGLIGMKEQEKREQENTNSKSKKKKNKSKR